MSAYKALLRAGDILFLGNPKRGQSAIAIVVDNHDILLLRPFRSPLCCEIETVEKWRQVEICSILDPKRSSKYIYLLQYQSLARASLSRVWCFQDQITSLLLKHGVVIPTPPLFGSVVWFKRFFKTLHTVEVQKSTAEKNTIGLCGDAQRKS